jgi:hypothetical protein
MTDQSGYLGTMDVGSLSHEYNLLSFIVQQHIGQMATIELVQVKAVHGGGVAPTGTVDVQPMVNQIDGAGNPTPHGVIYGVPYFRIQGGTTAVINDPLVGDIGLCAFSSRDISKVKSTGAVANPGSFARFDWADGLYFGAFLGKAPTSYVQTTSAAINIVNPTKVEIDAPSAVINASGSAVINSPSVTLGGSSGGAAVARVGDTVNLGTGVIMTGSSKVKSL